MIETDNVWLFRATTAKFGPNVIEELGYDLRKLGCKKPFVITTKGWVKRGLIERLRKILQGFELDYWDGVEPEPSSDSVEEAAKALKESGADCVIAVGGGSTLDTAKVAAVIAKYGGTVRDYVAKPHGAGKPVPGPIYPLIAIPTTAGTGSEVTPVAVVTLKDEGVKTAVSSDYIRPSLALLDPLLTVTMPAKVTADTGMDALSHAVESYLARPYNTRPKPESPDKRPTYVGSYVITETLAEKAIELIGNYLRRAVFVPTDLEARSAMLIASHIAGIAFGNSGTGLAHAASYPLGSRYKVTHGEAVGILLPAVVEVVGLYNPRKAIKIGELLSGEKPPSGGVLDKVKWAADRIRDLQRTIGFTPGLEALGVKEEDIREMAQETLTHKRLLSLCPKEITLDDVIYVYKRSMRNY